MPKSIPTDSPVTLDMVAAVLSACVGETRSKTGLLGCGRVLACWRVDSVSQSERCDCGAFITARRRRSATLLPYRFAARQRTTSQARGHVFFCAAALVEWTKAVMRSIASGFVNWKAVSQLIL